MSIEIITMVDNGAFFVPPKINAKNIDDKHVVRARLCKKTNKWIKSSSKTAKKLIPLTYLSKFGHHHVLPTLLDKLNELGESVFANELYYELNSVIPLSPWSCNFKFDVHDHEVIHIFLKQVVLVANGVFYINKLWCWESFLNLKPFRLSSVDGEICVHISDFVTQTDLIETFPNHDDFFENDISEYSPGASDVVFKGDSIYIKVEWIWKKYLYTFP